MPGLPWYLLPIWPLIFRRIQRLKAWFRAAGGPGSQMLWGVMRNGRVVLIGASDDLSVQPSCCFREPVSARLRLTVMDATTPYARQMPGLQAILSAMIEPHTSLHRKYAVTIPDT